ncbi:hypothetical protein QYM36_010122 [Artemia franciscana]|uniref:Uncharacterized protein n=1 Tax=Artemia franciscana TaxID=6661 RepID=A0AA88HSD3_ARTSF|nr:hypothetical protein QYM36_010122 [Artemia franciscana]
MLDGKVGVLRDRNFEITREAGSRVLGSKVGTLVCEVCKEIKKDERYFEFNSYYRATHLQKHYSEELKNRAEVKIKPKKVQKTTLFDIPKWLRLGGSQKTPEESVAGESDLEQQDASLSQFSSAKSIESVFRGASCFGASESRPPCVLVVSVIIHVIVSEKKPQATSYLSGCSQNELIAIVGPERVQRIVVQVNGAHFFGMFSDGTPAVSREERLAVGVRYVDGDGAAKERLLFVVDSESKKGVDLSETCGRLEGAKAHISKRLGRNVPCPRCLAHGGNIIVEHYCE